MRVSYKDNTLKVTTNVTEETIKKGFSDLVARDEKGNAQYAMAVSKNGAGSLDVNGMKCNTFIDGKAAVVIVEPMGTTQEDVQRKYGEALLAAEKYTAQIATQAADKEATISGLFTEEA